MHDFILDKNVSKTLVGASALKFFSNMKISIDIFYENYMDEIGKADLVGRSFLIIQRFNENFPVIVQFNSTLESIYFDDLVKFIAKEFSCNCIFSGKETPEGEWEVVGPLGYIGRISPDPALMEPDEN